MLSSRLNFREKSWFCFRPVLFLISYCFENHSERDDFLSLKFDDMRYAIVSGVKHKAQRLSNSLNYAAMAKLLLPFNLRSRLFVNGVNQDAPTCLLTRYLSCQIQVSPIIFKNFSLYNS